MDRYTCHKEVEAAKIQVIDHNNKIIHFVDDLRIIVTAAWLSKHSPEPGGYFVRYKDGYESYSPAEAFEGGYTLQES